MNGTLANNDSRIDNFNISICSNYSEASPDEKGNDIEPIIFEYCAISIGIIGTLANGIVFAIFILSQKKKAKLATSSEFILNQLALDLFSCVSLILVYGWKILNSQLERNWDSVTCFLFGTETILWAGVTGSTLNLVFITAERYLKIVHNSFHQQHYRKWMTHSLVSFAWIGGTSIFPPNFVSFKITSRVCIAWNRWPHEYDGLLYSCYLLTIQYALPMCVFIFCYWRILAKVRKSAKYFDNCDTVNAHRQSQLVLVKTMVVITVLFTVCWTPNTILFMVTVVESNPGMQSSIWYATVALALFTVCVHPFIYGVRDEAVRKIIAEWLRSYKLYIH